MYLVGVYTSSVRVCVTYSLVRVLRIQPTLLNTKQQKHNFYVFLYLCSSEPHTHSSFFYCCQYRPVKIKDIHIHTYLRMMKKKTQIKVQQ